MSHFGWAGHLWQAVADFLRLKFLIFVTGAVRCNKHRDNHSFRHRWKTQNKAINEGKTFRVPPFIV